MHKLSIGCQKSISHLSGEKQKIIIELTQKFGKYLISNSYVYSGLPLGYWEETIEYVEKTNIKDINRFMRNLYREYRSSGL